MILLRLVQGKCHCKPGVGGGWSPGGLGLSDFQKMSPEVQSVCLEGYIRIFVSDITKVSPGLVSL